MTEIARRARLSISIAGHDVSKDLAPYVTDFSYTDNVSGKADEIQLTLHDREGQFNGEWMPEKGMEIEASILCLSWEEAGEDIQLPCGKFKIDEVEFSGPPDKVQIKAVASELSGPLRDSKKTRGWEKISLEAIAGQIASENSLELMYYGPKHKFERQDQRNESDLAFVNRLAGDCNMNCKTHDGKLILFDADEAEAADESLEIPKRGGMYSPTSYSFKSSSSGTDYQDAEVAYNDPQTGTTHTAQVKSTKKRNTRGEGKKLAIQRRAENAEHAAKLGKAELRKANSEEQTSSIEIMGCPRAAAGQTIKLTGFGSFSGKYFIKTATHKLGASYGTSLELTTPSPTEVVKVANKYNEAAVAAKQEAANEEVEALNERLDALALEGLEQFLKKLPDHISAPYELILCLPAILDEEIKRAKERNDTEWAGGMALLKQALIRWLGFKALVGPDNNSNTLWVDWNWLLSEEKAKMAYGDIKANIFNKAARLQLANRLLEQKKFTDKKEYFNFITKIPQNWPATHHQSRPVKSSFFDRVFLSKAHVAALGDYRFYALADGYVEPEGEGKYMIHIDRVAIVMRDSFDFAGWQPLGVWDCEELKYKGWDVDPTKANTLWNQHFESLREDYGNGADFYLATPPKEIEEYRGLKYRVTVCGNTISL